MTANHVGRRGIADRFVECSFADNFRFEIRENPSVKRTVGRPILPFVYCPCRVCAGQVIGNRRDTRCACCPSRIAVSRSPADPSQFHHPHRPKHKNQSSERPSVACPTRLGTMLRVRKAATPQRIPPAKPPKASLAGSPMCSIAETIA